MKGRAEDIAPVRAAHIHAGAAGANGPVVVADHQPQPALGAARRDLHAAGVGVPHNIRQRFARDGQDVVDASGGHGTAIGQVDIHGLDHAIGLHVESNTSSIRMMVTAEVVILRG